MTVQRCGWCSSDPLYMSYHDEEWGKPEFEESRLFEMLCLEGQQAGLSWITVLKKREAYRQHFFQYSIEDIAQLTDEQLEHKLSDTGLIRHLGKLKAIRDNATAWQALKSQGYNMTEWLWETVKQHPIINDVTDYRQAPAQTEQSLQLSKRLKKQGFKFVGPTTCYAFMQAVGMVNDHENHCSFRS
ncbi:DNA-3-methyladenine glycosylase I [Acinetobacter sp. S40]|uniref:DNA-3-methyladenine glycosylase I n=1 Tax=unclassified Acinetobacter TaxID=196816 RepID=UPI00190BDD34|nr:MULTISPECIES: DNA-3-methyladenine glycosylase I [unclassified Acinetobacter]MBJ9983859.1 DNA-3-methyladenine glycosylase I [Acinetobacter sp. S40]MBK0065017.1 DNA-3-methyladenine glycosylase I [Acinetobacter sp. S55]MBK0065323.1 DNA-3-methyladenine glycosylase I [Acinetobacter sp. S54]